jgi:hypothetical protein
MKMITQKALDRHGMDELVRNIFFSLQTYVEHDELMAYRGSDPRDPFERQKVKVAHAQRARGERERGRFGVGVGVQGAVYVNRRAARAGAAR